MVKRKDGQKENGLDLDCLWRQDSNEIIGIDEEKNIVASFSQRFCSILVPVVEHQLRRRIRQGAWLVDSAATQENLNRESFFFFVFLFLSQNPIKAS